MIHTKSSITILFFISATVLLLSCGTDREVTVVDRDPDAADVDLADEGDVGEQVLRIGELNPIRSLDPLYAVNTTSRRAVTQLYEGLVRFDENNEIQPAGARSWDVSNDSLTYTFRLNRDVYFHDSEVFHNGIGRRVRAEDYKQAFLRMASPDVPSQAAELFLDHIRGFEAYYREQREVYFPEDRFVDDIEGIQVRNDSTLVFRLNEPSENFLKKLASPYAVVYPREAVQDENYSLRHDPVGSGPFTMENTVGDSIYVLGQNEQYLNHATEESGHQIDRLEILHIPDETRLFRQLSMENLDMIVDLGPQMIAEVVDSNNTLHEAYASDFDLKVNERSEPVTLEFNPTNRYRLSREHAIALSRKLSEDAFVHYSGIPSMQVTYHYPGDEDTDSDEDEYQDDEYYSNLKDRFAADGDEALPVAFQRDTDVALITGMLLNQLSDELEFSLIPRRISSRDIFMYSSRPVLSSPFEQTAVGNNEILRINYDRYLITNKETEGIYLNNLAWWLDLSRATVPEVEPEI